MNLPNPSIHVAAEPISHHSHGGYRFATATIPASEGLAMFRASPFCRLCGGRMAPDADPARRPVILQRMDATPILVCGQCDGGDDPEDGPAFRCRVVPSMPTPTEIRAEAAAVRETWDDLHFLTRVPLTVPEVRCFAEAVQ